MQKDKVEIKLREDILQLCKFFDVNYTNFLKEPINQNKVKRNVIFHILVYKYNYKVSSISYLLKVSVSVIYNHSRYNIDMNLVESFEKTFLKDLLTKEMLFEKLCELYNINVKEHTSTNSDYSTIKIKHVMVYILIHHFGLLYRQIASLIGYKTHINIIHILYSIEFKIDNYNDYKSLYKIFLKSELNGIRLNYEKQIKITQNAR